MAEQYRSVEQDIKLAQTLLFQAAQCVDRIHRSMFIGQETWQENMMVLSEKAQRDIRHARRYLERMRLLDENWAGNGKTEAADHHPHHESDPSNGRHAPSATLGR